jgi:hypothetical protein
MIPTGWEIFVNFNLPHYHLGLHVAWKQKSIAERRNTSCRFVEINLEVEIIGK